MAKYRKISPRIWNDAKVRELTDKGKLAFLFMLTHPTMTPFGAIRANVPGLAFELGWSPKTFRNAMNQLCEKGMARFDEAANLIWFPNFLKYNRPESPNVIKSWAGAFEDLPECSLQEAIGNALARFVESLGRSFVEAFREAFAEGFEEAFQKGLAEGFQEGFEQPSRNQEQEQEQEIKGNLNTLPYPSQARGECDGQDCSSAFQAEEMPGARHGSREKRDNPSATGKNPRAQGTNPRTTGDNHREQRKPTGNSLPELHAQMRGYTDNPALLKTLEDFRLMRERLRKPMTGRALEILLGKLSELAVDDTAKIAVLEQSILNSWQGIFPLRQAQDARASPNKPATPTEFQKNKQEQREMAKMLWEVRQARKQCEVQNESERREPHVKIITNGIGSAGKTDGGQSCISIGTSAGNADDFG